MKKMFFPAVAVAALLTSSAAFAADCDGALKNLDQEIAKNDKMSWAVRSGMQREMRQLHNAARILAANGKDDACEDVVAAMKDMAENPRRDGEKTAARREGGYKAWIDSEKERLATAAPVGELRDTLRVRTVLGADVRNTNNENIGAIDDVLLDPQSGKINYAVVGHGGFLGMGDKDVLVPWQKFKVTKDRDVFVLNVSKKTMEDAPDYDEKKWSEMNEDERREKNDKFYDKLGSQN